jgi:hypothetical protein
MCLRQKQAHRHRKNGRTFQEKQEKKKEEVGLAPVSDKKMRRKGTKNNKNACLLFPSQKLTFHALDKTLLPTS